MHGWVDGCNGKIGKLWVWQICPLGCLQLQVMESLDQNSFGVHWPKSRSMMAWSTPLWGRLHLVPSRWLVGFLEEVSWLDSLFEFGKRERVPRALPFCPIGPKKPRGPSVHHYLTTRAWVSESVTRLGSGNYHNWLKVGRSWAETEQFSKPLCSSTMVEGWAAITG